MRNLRGYIQLIAKNNNIKEIEAMNFDKYEYPSDITVITRYDLLKYILTLDEKKKKDENIKKHMDIIVKEYPIVKEVQMIYKDFHDTIFNKDIEMLDIFIELYEDKISTFCGGLKKDIAAVQNAISHEINSGFVEGNNNKFKLIKRIVCGKQKLCNLFKKSYLCFLSTLDNFALEEIVSQVLDEDKK